MPYPFVGDCDLSKIHMAPLANKDGRKQVELFLDDKSMQNSNRVKFQLCPDQTEPLIARYSLDQVRDDGDPTRRGLTVIVQNKRAVESLTAMEDAIVAQAIAKSRDWFKKELTEEQVRARFKTILTPHPEDEGTFLMKIKIKCKGSRVPTKILRKISDTQLRASDEDDLSSRGALVVPLVSTFSLWFMAGDAQFGVSFQAEEMIVTPGDAPSEVSNFTLSAPMQVVKSESGAPEETEAADENEPGAKRFKVELEDESAMCTHAPPLAPYRRIRKATDALACAVFLASPSLFPP